MTYTRRGAKAMFVSLLVIDVVLFALFAMSRDTPSSIKYERSQKPAISRFRKKNIPLARLVNINRSKPVENGWYESCRIRLADTLMRTNESCLGGMYNDILLVIVYHFPFYESIPTLTKFYNLAFKKLVICGPLQSTLYPVMTVEVHDGHFAYECLGQAIRNHPGYSGYMYINDDMIVNWWNLEHFNNNRIWVGHTIGLGTEVGKPQPNDNWPWWSKKSPGLKTCTQAVNQLKSHALSTARTPWLIRSYYTYINNSRGKEFCRKGLSDFFYVPKRFAHKFQIISNIFFRNNVFLEIAVPTVLTFLDSEHNFEHVDGLYLADKYGYHANYNDGKIFWTEYNYKPLYFIHPFKLHANRNHLNEFLFKTYVQYYGDKVIQCSND